MEASIGMAKRYGRDEEIAVDVFLKEVKLFSLELNKVNLYPSKVLRKVYLAIFSACQLVHIVSIGKKDRGVVDKQ